MCAMETWSSASLIHPEPALEGSRLRSPWIPLNTRCPTSTNSPAYAYYVRVHVCMYIVRVCVCVCGWKITINNNNRVIMGKGFIPIHLLSISLGHVHILCGYCTYALHVHVSATQVSRVNCLRLVPRCPCLCNTHTHKNEGEVMPCWKNRGG